MPISFDCPTCHRELRFDSNGRAECGHGVQLAEGFICCTSEETNSAKAILEWPAKLLAQLEGWAAGVDNGPVLTRELGERGLLAPDGSLTDLGSSVRYHLQEHRWQATRDPLDGLTTLADLGDAPCVLDVGCGAAQTLRLLGARKGAALVGVDRDLAPLALGLRLADLEGVTVVLAGASAYALPFRDASFDLVVTRVALNYMHQRSALAEMVRVVRPGGRLYCRVEGPLHDLLQLVHPGSLMGFVCGCRDLAYGVVNAVSGWQPEPGSRWTGGRAFATRPRLARIMDSLGCEVVAASPTGPRAFGGRKQLALLARRRVARGS